VLVAGSLPLAAPWDGADKVLARTIVLADRTRRYIVQTGRDEQWPTHVETLREAHPAEMPGSRARLEAARLFVRASCRADVIHIVASRRRPSPVDAALVRWWSKLVDRPIVHSLPALSSDVDPADATLGDITVVFSRHTAERLRAAGVPDVVAMFPPVRLDALCPAEDPGAVRRRYRLGPRPILYPAHLDAASGIREAILAMARLPERLSDATLVLPVRWRAGQDVEATIGALDAIARTAGVAERLRWITKVQDMPGLISACHLTALVPRDLDGKMDLPLVLLESVALGRPIVVADRPPINEALFGGGLGVPFGDLDALAAVFARLLERPDLRRSLADAGRRQLAVLADPARTCREYAKVYERALHSRALRVRVA
jgi:glycosyltransferase involved in cell wall biosynthesis